MTKITAEQGKALYQHALQSLGNTERQLPFLIVGIGIETGARIGEIVDLTSDSLIEPNKILLFQRKTKSVRTAEVSQAVYDTLCEIATERYQMFPYIDYGYMYRFVKGHYPVACFERTGRRNTITHILRKIAVRIAWEEGKSIKEIINYFGWKSPESVLYYL